MRERGIVLRRYRIGEVAAMLGLKPYTLKHYEDKGLIVPQIDPESGYRYYTYHQFGQVIKIRNYRAMGFSVEDVKETLESSSADELDRIKQRIACNEEEIRKLEHQNRIMAIREASIGRALDHLGSWEIVERHVGINFLPHFVMGEALEDVRAAMTEQRWTSLMEEAEIAFRIDLSIADAPLTWGLALYGDLSEFPHLAQNVETVPASRRLDVFCEGPRTEEMAWVVDAIRKAAAQAGVTLGDSALCFVNAVDTSEAPYTHTITATVSLAD